MNRGIRFEWNKDALGEILRSKEVADWVEDTAQDLVEDANDTLKGDDNGYEWSSKTTKKRHRAHVWADSVYARRSNAKHNTLMKMMMERDQGRKS